MIDVDKEQSKILCEKNELFAIIMRTSRHKMECGKGNCCIQSTLRKFYFYLNYANEEKKSYEKHKTNAKTKKSACVMFMLHTVEQACNTSYLEEFT